MTTHCNHRTDSQGHYCAECRARWDRAIIVAALRATHERSGVQTDDVAGRRKRLNETVERIGKALEAGRALASIFPLEKDAMPQAVAVVEQRRSLLNVACHEFKTTFLHDLAAVTSSLSSADRGSK